MLVSTVLVKAGCKHGEFDGGILECMQSDRDVENNYYGTLKAYSSHKKIDSNKKLYVIWKNSDYMVADLYKDLYQYRMDSNGYNIWDDDYFAHTLFNRIVNNSAGDYEIYKRGNTPNYKYFMVLNIITENFDLDNYNIYITNRDFKIKPKSVSTTSNRILKNVIDKSFENTDYNKNSYYKNYTVWFDKYKVRDIFLLKGFKKHLEITFENKTTNESHIFKIPINENVPDKIIKARKYSHNYMYNLRGKIGLSGFDGRRFNYHPKLPIILPIDNK